MKNFRNITESEIQQLIKQGCQSKDWDRLYIEEDTDLYKIHNVVFSGENHLSRISGTRKFCGGLTKENGISNVHLHNCKIRKDPFINNVKNHIANYEIGDDVWIENVDMIVVDGLCSFGNDVQVNVINEGGGREISIFNELSAQIAYLLALYRHRTSLILQLKKMIELRRLSVTSKIGKIGNEVKILNTGTIKGVCIGSGSHIDSTSRLINGSINSTIESRVYIGGDVIATNFIICSDTKIDNASILSNCFVGQGCRISENFSADHSVFFANCQGFRGEAYSIFAGPYTVTHHKSTLLIAGLFSFMNAGSGSNQSNHMYKLGPIHQGIMERGAKTTSDSYLLWPSKIGPFTLVIGRHYKHVDSSDFPFSYLIEKKDKSYLVPGVNLKSVGTVRDVQKWPNRDNRNQNNRRDIVNFNLLSPYTIQKVFNGLVYLYDISKIPGGKLKEYSYKDMIIKKPHLEDGIKMYNIIIHKFLGNSILSRIENKDIDTIEELINLLKPRSTFGKSKWIDVSGLICPLSALNIFIEKIENESLKNIEDVLFELEKIHQNYYEYEWNWVVDLMEKFYKIKIDTITKEKLIEIIEKWKKSVIDLNSMLYKDASKEFDLKTYIGFGVDGEEEEKLADFKSVRGVFKTNPIVLELLNHSKKKEALGDRIIKKIRDMK